MPEQQRLNVNRAPVGVERVVGFSWDQSLGVEAWQDFLSMPAGAIPRLHHRGNDEFNFLLKPSQAETLSRIVGTAPGIESGIPDFVRSAGQCL